MHHAYDIAPVKPQREKCLIHAVLLVNPATPIIANHMQQ